MTTTSTFGIGKRKKLQMTDAKQVVEEWGVTRSDTLLSPCNKSRIDESSKVKLYGLPFKHSSKQLSEEEITNGVEVFEILCHHYLLKKTISSSSSRFSKCADEKEPPSPLPEAKRPRIDPSPSDFIGLDYKELVPCLMFGGRVKEICLQLTKHLENLARDRSCACVCPPGRTDIQTGAERWAKLSRQEIKVPVLNKIASMFAYINTFLNLLRFKFIRETDENKELLYQNSVPFLLCSELWLSLARSHVLFFRRKSYFTSRDECFAQKISDRPEVDREIPDFIEEIGKVCDLGETIKTLLKPKKHSSDHSCQRQCMNANIPDLQNEEKSPTNGRRLT